MTPLREIARCPLFTALPLRVIEALYGRFHQRRLSRGEALFQAGTSSEVLYVILSGRLDLLADGQVVRSFGPGGFLGTAGFIDPGLHTLGCVAAAPTRLLWLASDEFAELWASQPSVAAFLELAVGSALISELRDENERLVRLCDIPLDELDHEGLRRALQVIDTPVAESSS